MIEDGTKVKPLRVDEVMDNTPGAHRVVVEIQEGRNREVRQLAEIAGMDLKALKRTRVGGLRMPAGLKLGNFVQLKSHEVHGWGRMDISPV